MQVIECKIKYMFDKDENYIYKLYAFVKNRDLKKLDFAYLQHQVNKNLIDQYVSFDYKILKNVRQIEVDEENYQQDVLQETIYQILGYRY